MDNQVSSQPPSQPPSIPQNQDNASASSFFFKNRIILGLVIIALLFGAIFFASKGQKPFPSLSLQPTPTPIPFDGFTDVVKKEETLSQTMKQKPQYMKLKLPDGISYIREQGEVIKALSPLTSYIVKLPSVGEREVVIEGDTLIADAWFGYDRQDQLVRIQYATILKEELQRLKIGEVVQVMYKEDDLSIKSPLKLKEFVLME